MVVSFCSMLCRNDNVLRAARMKNNGDQPGISVFSRVARDAMQTAGWLLKRFPRVVDLRGLIIDAKLVRRFDYIHKCGPRMSMRCASLTGAHRHLHHRDGGVLPVELFLQAVGSEDFRV